jgi:nitroreductase/dihydropteridine reductase
MSLQQSLEWRYATKKFDASKKISAEQLNDLLHTTQLAPSSFGLQHYKILVIENADIRAKLREASFGQSQITDASHLIVFAAETKIDEEYVKQYVDLTAQIRKVDRESLAGFENYLLGSINSKTQEEKTVWAHKQAYIALGILVGATAEARIDICPMEGFNGAQYDEILGLAEKGLTASVIATIGFRSEDDQTSKYAKVRKPFKELFINI